MDRFICSLVIVLSTAHYLCEALVTFNAQLDCNVINPLHTLLKGFITHILFFNNGRYEFSRESEYAVSFSASNFELLKYTICFLKVWLHKNELQIFFHLSVPSPTPEDACIYAGFGKKWKQTALCDMQSLDKLFLVEGLITKSFIKGVLQSYLFYQELHVIVMSGLYIKHYSGETNTLDSSWRIHLCCEVKQLLLPLELACVVSWHSEGKMRFSYLPRQPLSQAMQQMEKGKHF